EVGGGGSYFGVKRLQWLIPVGSALAIGAALIVRTWSKMDKLQKRYFSGAAAAFALMCFAASINRYSDVLPTIVINLAGILVASLCIGKGITEESRLIFWAGSLFLATLVISRFFEYESSLLLKSAAFMGCGIITILAGIGYERFLHRKEAFAQ